MNLLTEHFCVVKYRKKHIGERGHLLYHIRR